MSKTDITTSQYVCINVTTAGVGERIVARIIDYAIIYFYTFSILFLVGMFGDNYYSYFDKFGVAISLILLFIILLPAVAYSFLMETFMHGQTIGKQIMHTRVVKTDGSEPGIGDYFMRWVMLIIDVYTSFIGLFFIVATQRRQRIGDLAAGTMVISVPKNASKKISLDSFFYADSNYRPVYPEAQSLTLGQVDLIKRTLTYSEEQPMAAFNLAQKVAKHLDIAPKKDMGSDGFLTTLLHDYNYYAAELV
jgi:uncharacterized RDD family membrane protein YckC